MYQRKKSRAKILAQTFQALEQGAKGDTKDILQDPGFPQADQALPISREITAIAPNQLNGWNLNAEANLQLKNYSEAVASLEMGRAAISAPKPGQQPSAIYLRLEKRIQRYRQKLAAAARQ